MQKVCFFGCLFVEWKIIESENGEDHERMEKKTMGQHVAHVKKRKGGKMARGMKGQQRQER